LTRRYGGPVAIAVAALALFAPTAAAQENEAEIDFTFSEDGFSFNVTSDKDISNVVVEDCEGDTHTHDNLSGLSFNHTETFVVAAVIVKSGITEERFENPNADCDGEIECPEMDLTAIANADGSISLNWTDVGDAADEYNIYRGADGGDLVFLASTSDTSFTDETTAVGVTYEYGITIVKDGRESEVCARAVATAIPFFGSAVLGAVALVGGIGAFVAMRRRT
jgi:hypothetical protein